MEKNDRISRREALKKMSKTALALASVTMLPNMEVLANNRTTDQKKGYTDYTDRCYDDYNNYNNYYNYHDYNNYDNYKNYQDYTNICR